MTLLLHGIAAVSAAAMAAAAGGASTDRRCTQGHAHQDSVYSVAFSPEGRLLASAGGRTVCVWEAATGRSVQRISTPAARVSPVWFLPDGSLLGVAALDGRGGPTPRFEARVWDPSTGRLLRRFAVSAPPHALSPDGLLLVTAARPDEIHPPVPGVLLVDTGNGRVAARLATSVEPIALAFAEDGRLAVYGAEARGCASGTLADCDLIELWDVAGGRRERRITVTGADLGALAFSPDGRLLAGGDEEMEDAHLKLWDAATGRLLRGWGTGRARVHDVTFSPDGSRLYSGERFGHITGWPLQPGGRPLDFDGGGSVGQLAASPDGRWLAHADSHWASHSVSLLDARTGRCVGWR